MHNRTLYKKHKTMVQFALTMLDQTVTTVSIPWKVVSHIQYRGAGLTIGMKYITSFRGLSL